jgi:hypothetical protein
VRWPDATDEEWKDLSLEQYTTLKQGMDVSPATAQRRKERIGTPELTLRLCAFAGEFFYSLR